MLMITPIKNVQNTINKNNISFKSGVQTNFGANVINTTDVKNEGGFLTDFLGAIKQSPLFYDTFIERQQAIEKGLDLEQKKIDAIA